MAVVASAKTPVKRSMVRVKLVLEEGYTELA